jgi:hypothetical protein
VVVLHKRRQCQQPTPSDNKMRFPSFSNLLPMVALAALVLGVSLPDRDVEVSARAAGTKYVFAHFLVSGYIGTVVHNHISKWYASCRLGSLHPTLRMTGPTTCSSRKLWVSTVLLLT